MSVISATHTGFLLDGLQNLLGGEQEVNEAAKAVSPVLPLHHAKELPQDSGSSGSEGAVQRRQGILDTVVQRLSVLGKFKKKGDFRINIFTCVKLVLQ